MMNFVRTATAAEIETFEKVEAILLAMDDDKAEAIIDVISDYVFSITDREAAYKQVRRAGEELGLTVEELTTWFACEED
jgi:hypothetical protein